MEKFPSVDKLLPKLREMEQKLEENIDKAFANKDENSLRNLLQQTAEEATSNAQKWITTDITGKIDPIATSIASEKINQINGTLAKTFQNLKGKEIPGMPGISKEFSSAQNVLANGLSGLPDISVMQKQLESQLGNILSSVNKINMSDISKTMSQATSKLNTDSLSGITSNMQSSFSSLNNMTKDLSSNASFIKQNFQKTSEQFIKKLPVKNKEKVF